ncbi:mediator of RNA polymerase II transcription subunit 1-like isoform X2 [Pseudophryne corroboree]|uniref:mediator of RNA polymerase II transcription subunit 1-like isoform X2 n=1 Tax=Pseudophryne corroboree TaxID=495146 RepID=UPI003081EF24
MLGAPVPTAGKSILEKLHLKYSQKPWTETFKLVRYCLDKPAGRALRGCVDHPVLRCTNTLQEAIKAKSLSTLLTRIESISKQKGLESHLGPNGRICYITSEMFYIEVQVKRNGHVASVKLAHHGESPTMCKELLQLLRTNHFDGFGKSLEGLLNLYNIPGNSDTKAKVYLALHSLEDDLSTIFNLNRPATDKDRVMAILHGKVGCLAPRSGGTPMKTEYYISPYQILEQNLKLAPHVVRSNASITVAGTKNWYRLPVTPLFHESTQEGNGIQEFSKLTEESSMVLPACFFLTFSHPAPFVMCLIQKIQNITGLPVIATIQAPLHKLLLDGKHEKLTKEESREIQYVVSLPDCMDHCYVINSNTDKESTVIGVLVNKIPFTHPSCVPLILEVLRHQEAYNTLLRSCISNTINPKNNTDMLHFEVSLQRDLKICISFQHPTGGSLSCVVIDVLCSRKLTCSLYTSSSDPPSPCSSEFIVKVLERCMSIPITMRTIFKKAQKLEITQKMETNCTSSNNILPPQTPAESPPAGTDPSHNILRETISASEKTPHAAVYESNEQFFPDAIGSIGPSPCPAQEPNYSFTEDAYFSMAKVNANGVEETNSSPVEESYSSLPEEPNSSIVQELSPIMAEVPSPNMGEEPSSSITGELSSSIADELSLSVSGFMKSQSIPEDEKDCYPI